MLRLAPYALVAVAAGVLATLLPMFGTVALAAALALALVAVLSRVARAPALAAAAALAWGCLLSLGWHFATDHFQLQQVWLYSSAGLPLHFKVASVLAGDEGTTLLLATLLLTLAARGARQSLPGQAATAAIAAWYTLVTLWLVPFAATPANLLAQAPYQGMNAHLQKVWMLIHPPLVLLAYAWSLTLAAPALGALRGRLIVWPVLYRWRARRAWLLASAGIGFGMAWAFEDAMYGRLWHWDPVQTAVFCLWCLLSAHLHGIVGWKTGRRRAWLMPWAGLLAALMAPLVMAVTRNPLLASSHRYVDAGTWKAHVVLAIALLLAALMAVVLGCHQRRAARAPGCKARAASDWGLWLAQLAFVLAALVGVTQLAWAFVAEAIELARPDRYKPFLAMVAKLTSGSQLDALQRAFDQWDVDGYVVAHQLLLPLVVLGLVGGWYFFRRISRRTGWWSLILAGAVVGLSAALGGVLTHGYAGAGILSQNIVQVLPLYDATLASAAYLALGCLAWAARASGKAGWRGAAASLPLGVIHAGVVVMFVGGMVAIALNSYSQHEMTLDDGQSSWIHDAHGYSFRMLDLALSSGAGDGGWQEAHSIRAVSSIRVVDRDGQVLDGQTLYRDNRAPPERYHGTVRQMCEFLDYRYARHVMTPGYLLDPLIDRKWRQSVQFWISPADVVEVTGSSTASGTVVAVVKVFPLLSLLWVGLGMALTGAVWMSFVQGFRR